MSERNYSKLIRSYPKYISKEQMYKICHISKRTALYLLESGLVKSQSSGKQTRKYKIAMTDIVSYLKERELYPERYLAPEGWYGGQTSVFDPLPPEVFEKMREFFISKLEPLPDVMGVQAVAEFTGYTDTTVVRWCASKSLHCFKIRGVYVVPKLSLIDFLMSNSFRRIRTKSDKHREFLRELHKEEFVQTVSAQNS